MANNEFLFPLEDGEPQSADAQIQLENDLLKLKIRAEYGAVFGTDIHLPPKREKEFLEQIIALESMMAGKEMTSVFELIGRPDWIPLNEMPPGEVVTELLRLKSLLVANGLSLVVLHEYPPELIYAFITEELFFEEIPVAKVPGLQGVFLYEDFYPRHDMLIQELTIEFLEGWQQLHWLHLNELLYYVGVLPDDRIIQEQEMIAIMEEQAKRYASMQLFDFKIAAIHFEWKEEDIGLAFSEGEMQSMAILASGEPVYLQGEFRCFFCNTDGDWRLTFFYMPGFEWS